MLRSVDGTDEYVELVARYEVKTENPNLLQLAINKHNERTGQDSSCVITRARWQTGWCGILLMARTAINKDSLLTSLGGVGSKASVDILQTTALSDKYDMRLRKDAAGRDW